MAQIILALFLVVFGINLLFGLAFPPWITGLLALFAGVLIAMNHFCLRVDRK